MEAFVSAILGILLLITVGFFLAAIHRLVKALRALRQPNTKDIQMSATVTLKTPLGQYTNHITDDEMTAQGVTVEDAIEMFKSKIITPASQDSLNYLTFEYQPNGEAGEPRAMLMMTAQQFQRCELTFVTY